MIPVPRFYFHCINTWGCTLFWVKFGNAFAYFVVSFYISQMALSSNINFYLIARPDCAFELMAGKRKNIFVQESFYLHGILDDINEQDTSFVDCKYKHMMRSGAPPDKFGVLYSKFSYRISWFTSRIYTKSILRAYCSVILYICCFYKGLKNITQKIY